MDAQREASTRLRAAADTGDWPAECAAILHQAADHCDQATVDTPTGWWMIWLPHIAATWRIGDSHPDTDVAQAAARVRRTILEAATVMPP